MNIVNRIYLNNRDRIDPQYIILLFNSLLPQFSVNFDQLHDFPPLCKYYNTVRGHRRRRHGALWMVLPVGIWAQRAQTQQVPALAPLCLGITKPKDGH